MNEEQLSNMVLVFRDVARERLSQYKKHGIQENNTPGDWLAIWTEECLEVVQAYQSEKPWHKPDEATNLYLELIQHAATCIQWAEQISNDKQ